MTTPALHYTIEDLENALAAALVIRHRANAEQWARRDAERKGVEFNPDTVDYSRIDEDGENYIDWGELEDSFSLYQTDGNGGWTWVKAPLKLPGIGVIDDLAASHGGEGQGDEYWLVFAVKDDAGQTRMFQRDGWYASFDGGHYDGPTFEVHPVQKVVTVYEEIGK
ncbi:hypothetical protein ACFRAQ_34715 [Nocardia sp. NPDC056611]|uniref:hypothetical protein n=1 Tax=Nocardia sp. NPDC056611 TaxID=3345877 RepID=UPI00366CF187